MMDGTFTGVVDRIVDETAVILIENDGDVADEITIEVNQLPAEADEGAVLDVKIEDGEFADAVYRPNKTESRLETARDRLDNLSEPLSDEEE